MLKSEKEFGNVEYEIHMSSANICLTSFINLTYIKYTFITRFIRIKIEKLHIFRYYIIINKSDASSCQSFYMELLRESAHGAKLTNRIWNYGFVRCNALFYGIVERRSMTTLSNVLRTRDFNQNNCVKNWAFLYCTLMVNWQMLLSNRKINETYNDNKKTMAVSR